MTSENVPAIKEHAAHGEISRARRVGGGILLGLGGIGVFFFGHQSIVNDFPIPALKRAEVIIGNDPGFPNLGEMSYIAGSELKGLAGSAVALLVGDKLIGRKPETPETNEEPEDKPDDSL